MRYKSHIFHIRYRFVCLLVLFVALAVRGFGQCNLPIHLSGQNLPDSICSGQTINVTYDIVTEEVVPPTAQPMDIPVYSDDNDNDSISCHHTSTITYSGYGDQTITDTNSIKYVRLNIEYYYSGVLSIQLRCPSGQTASILNCGTTSVSSGASECLGFIPVESQGWSWNEDDEYHEMLLQLSFGVPDNEGWNYCWSNHMEVLDSIQYTNNPNGLIYTIPYFDTDFEHFYPSDVDNGSNFYHPDQNFSSLVGCPLEGDWSIDIVIGGQYVFDGEPDGTLFNWEIVFDQQPTDAGEVTNAEILPNTTDQSDTCFTTPVINNENETTTVSFSFTAPTVSSETSFSNTLRLTSTTGCTFDTTITFTVIATVFPPDTLYVCEGSSIPLDAGACVPNRMMQSFGFIDQFGDEWHSWMHGHNGPGNVEVDSFPEFVEALWQFPIRTKVFPAGGKVKLGTSNRTTGSMTSLPMSLQNAFDVTVRAKGWGAEPGTGATPKKTRVNVIVDKDQLTQQIQSFETSPTYYWPGDDAYHNYTLSFNGATIASTITVETVKANPATAYDTRLFLESVSASNEIEGCTYQWSFNGTLMPDSISQQISVTQAGTYTVTVDPHNGDCPRVKTFEVVVVPPPVVSISGDAEICEGEMDTLRAFPKGNGYQYNWNPSSGEAWIAGFSQDLSDIYINPAFDKNLSVTVTDTSNGCSGTAFFTVTVHEGGHSKPVWLVACDSIEYHGKTYSESVEKVIPSESNHFGCPDTLYNLYLQIYHSSDTVVYKTVCANYTWGDTTYTTSGVYIKKFPVLRTHPLDTSIVAECDSTVELHLTVNPTYHISIDTTICYWEKPFVFNGQTYNQSGHFTAIANSTTANGCDSIVTLDLTILPENRDSIFADICKGETYNSQYWGPLTPTETHSYQTVISHSGSCPETIILILTVHDSVHSHLYADLCYGDVYNENGFNITAADTTASSYVLYDTTRFGCDSIVTLHLNVTAPPVLDICQDTTIIAGSSASLWANGAYHYLWYPAGTLSDPYSATPLAFPTQTTYYHVIGYSDPNEQGNLVINGDFDDGFSATQMLTMCGSKTVTCTGTMVAERS